MGMIEWCKYTFLWVKRGRGKKEGRVSGTIMVFRPDLLDTKIPPERKEGEREKIYPEISKK